MNNLLKLLNRSKPYILALLGANVLFGCTQQVAVTEGVSTAQQTPSVQKKLPQANKGLQAKSSDSFVEFVGVNTHLTYTDTAYGNFNSIIKPKLRELGIRHIRDGGFNDATFFNKIKELNRQGIKTVLTFAANPPEEVVATAKTLKGAIEAVEGPNESDLEHFNFSYKGQRFPEGTRTYQQELYTAIKADPETKYLPVVLPSMGWGENAQKLGYVPWGDIGNMHSYPNLGNPPTDGLDWYFIPHVRTITGKTKPLWSTETGYHNYIKDDLGISERAGARYIPRVLFEQFNRGVKRAYLYEFINLNANKEGNGQNNYGLLRADGSPKPSYTTIKNLISLLKDPGRSFPLKSLDYKLSGNTTDVKQTLLQKRDGNFYLVLWQDARSWDNKKKKDIAISDRKVTLNLNTPISQVVAYQPIRSINPTWRKTNPSGRVKQLSINVPDYPLILKLVSARKK